MLGNTFCANSRYPDARQANTIDADIHIQMQFHLHPCKRMRLAADDDMHITVLKVNI